MADFTGLPDFGSAALSTEVSMIAPFGGGSYSVLPRQLELATNPEGTPKFELDLTQVIGDFSSSGQFAELDFSIAADFPLDIALSVLRTTRPSAQVKPVTFDGGFGRLYDTASVVELPPDVLNPIPLGWWSSDFARWTMRMSRDAGELIRGALGGQSSLLLGARVEASVTGIAPRLEVYVQFDPTALLNALLAGRPNRSVAVTDILSFFTAPLSKYPVTVTMPPGGKEGELAQILTDRVIMAYGVLTPSPGVADPAYVQFKPIEQIDTATTRWDLNVPTLVMRPYVFTLDPIGSIRALNNPAVLAAVVKEISVPAMNIGLHQIDLTASLPQSRTGIAAIGARVEMPPDPPSRPASISKTVLFTAPDDAGSVQLTLEASEALAYTVTCFGVIAAGDFVQQYNSDAQQHTENWVQLSARDFPLIFTNVIASSRLLNLASISGTFSYRVGTRVVQQPIRLAKGDPVGGEVTVAAPSGATDISVALNATPLDGSSPVALPASGPGRIQLDVNSFAGYGPHTVTAQCHLDSGTPALFIEVVYECDAANTQATPAKVALTTEQPSSTWSYVATSPFHAGYCYRVATGPGNPPNPWSAPLAPDVVLILDAEGRIEPTNLNTIPSGGSQSAANSPTVAL